MNAVIALPILAVQCHGFFFGICHPPQPEFNGNLDGSDDRVNVGTNNAVTNPISGGQQFYRLQQD